jgi:mono/diheme cytochrome c family protein
LLCAPCHGDDLKGGSGGIDLTERLPTISDNEAFQSIQHGVLPGMPAWSDSLSAEETRALIAYLRAETE